MWWIHLLLLILGHPKLACRVGLLVPPLLLEGYWGQVGWLGLLWPVVLVHMRQMQRDLFASGKLKQIQRHFAGDVINLPPVQPVLTDGRSQI